MVTDQSWFRLLQLTSPSLPIGMYSYSQGMETAVQEGWLRNVEDVENWLQYLLKWGLCRVDAPILARLHDAWRSGDETGVHYWSNLLAACRETSELRLEDRQTGQALARLLHQLQMADAETWIRSPSASLATLFSLAAVRWGIGKAETVGAYLWSWLENQVLCAVKLVPLGQFAGQQLLSNLSAQLAVQVTAALNLGDADIGGGCPGLSIASGRHETQYSRLFRS